MFEKVGKDIQLVYSRSLNISVFSYSCCSVSNFYDRVVNNVAVIDFLNIGIGSIWAGIFNVADIAIILGVFLLLFTQKKSSYGVKDY